jgi:hypothetical protein
LASIKANTEAIDSLTRDLTGKADKSQVDKDLAGLRLRARRAEALALANKSEMEKLAKGPSTSQTVGQKANTAPIAIVTVKNQ